MARIHGKNADLTLDSVAIEDELSEIRMDFDVEEADITAFADAWQNFISGKPDVRTELSGNLDPAASQGEATILAAIGGGPVTLLFQPTGSGPSSNNPQFTCTASGLAGVLVTRYEVDLPVGDKASYTATLQHSGVTTRAVS
jgi:hypothetical protein